MSDYGLTSWLFSPVLHKLKNRPPLVKLGLSPLGGRACFSNMQGQWMDTHHQYKRRNRVYYGLRSLALEQIDKGSGPDPTNHWSCNLQQIIHTSVLWVVVCLFVTRGSQGWCQRLVASWKSALWEVPLASHSWRPVDDGCCYHYCCCSPWAPSLHVSPIHGRASVLNNRAPCSLPSLSWIHGSSPHSWPRLGQEFLPWQTDLIINAQ